MLFSFCAFSHCDSYSMEIYKTSARNRTTDSHLPKNLLLSAVQTDENFILFRNTRQLPFENRRVDEGYSTHAFSAEPSPHVISLCQTNDRCVVKGHAYYTFINSIGLFG